MGAEQSQQAERRRDFEQDEIKLRNLIEKCSALDADHIDSLAYKRSDDFLDITYEQVMFPHNSSPKPFKKYRVKTVNYQPHIGSENLISYSHLTDVFCEADSDSISSSSYMSLVDQYLANQATYMKNIQQDEQTSKMLLRIYLSVAAANKKWKEQEKINNTDNIGSSTACGETEPSTSTDKVAVELVPRLVCPKARNTTEVLLITSVAIFSTLSNSISPTSTEAADVLDNLIEALMSQIDDSKLCDGPDIVVADEPSNLVNEYVFQRMFEIISNKFLSSDAHVGSKAISLLLVLAITEANAFSMLKVIKLVLEGSYQLEPSVFRLCSKFDISFMVQQQFIPQLSGLGQVIPDAQLFLMFVMQVLPHAYRKNSLRIKNTDKELSLILLLEFIAKFLEGDSADAMTISRVDSCLTFVSRIFQSSHEHVSPTMSYPVSYAIGDVVQRGDSWNGNDEDKQHNNGGNGIVVGLLPTGDVSVRWNESGILGYYKYNSSTCRSLKCVKSVDPSKYLSLTSASKDVLKALFFEALHASNSAMASADRVHHGWNQELLKAVSDKLIEAILLNIEAIFPKHSVDSFSLIQELLAMFGANRLSESFKPILLHRLSAIKSSDVIALLNTKMSENSSLELAPYESLAHECLRYLRNTFLIPFDSAIAEAVTDPAGVDVLEIDDEKTSSAHIALAPVFLVPSSGAELSESYSLVSFTKRHAFVTCPVVMLHDDGYWEWELESVFDKLMDEISAVGVAKLPIRQPAHDKSAEIWSVRCYEGKTYHNSTTSGKHHVGARPLTKINVADLCKFHYNTYTQELSLKVKKLGAAEYQDMGVIFNELPSGIAPFVGDYGTGRNSKWKILSLSHFQNHVVPAVAADSNTLDKMIKEQIARLLDSITMKLILHEVDAIMNHYYTTADYSPTVVSVNDSSNNGVTLLRQPSALPRGANGETVDAVIERMSVVIFPLLDSMQECLQALNDPTKRGIVLQNPVVKENLRQFVLGFVSSGVIALLKLILLQFPLVYNLYQETFRPIFEKLANISSLLDSVRQHVRSTLFENMSNELHAIQVVTISNCMSHTVRMRGHQKWLKSPLFFHSYDNRPDLKELESFLKKNLIEARTSASDSLIQKLKEYSRKCRPPVQVQGSCMDTYVYATWAALMYHEEAVELFQAGGLDDTNRMTRTWSLANTKVRAHIGRHLDTPTEASVKMEILQRATFLLKFEPVRGNDHLIIEFVLQGPRYEDINSLIYENNIACNLRLEGLTSALPLYSSNNDFAPYIPFILRSAMTEHQTSRSHSRGIEVNYMNKLSGMSKSLHGKLIDAHRNLLRFLINSSIKRLSNFKMDSSEAKERTTLVSMGTLTLLLQDFGAKDILDLATDNVLELLQSCIEMKHTQLSALASKVLELFCINLSKFKLDDAAVAAKDLNLSSFYGAVLKILSASITSHVELLALINNMTKRTLDDLESCASNYDSRSKLQVVTDTMVYISMEESGFIWTYPKVGTDAPSCDVPIIHSFSFYICLQSLSDGLITSTGSIKSDSDPWSAISVGLSRGKFVVKIANLKCPFIASSNKCAALNTWMQFGYVVNRKENTLDLYIDGHLDASVQLSPSLLAESITRTILDYSLESAHPYKDNASDWYTVHIPGAIKYSVSFDARTKTESGCDYLMFYEGTDRKKQVGEKYSGGYNNRDPCFPGLNGRPVLEINGPIFQFNFVSDSSTNDWGWKCNIEAVTETISSASLTNRVFEVPQIHIGKTPDGNSVTGFVTGVALVYKETPYDFGLSASGSALITADFSLWTRSNSAEYYKMSLSAIGSLISIITAVASSDSCSHILQEILSDSKHLLSDLHTLILQAPSSIVRLSSAKLVSLLTRVAPINLIRSMFSQSILCRESASGTIAIDSSFMTQSLTCIGDSTNLFKLRGKSQRAVMPQHHFRPSSFVNETIGRRLLQSLIDRWYMSDDVAADFVMSRLRASITQLVQDLLHNEVATDACDFYHGLVTTLFPCNIYNQLLLPGTVVMSSNKLLGEQVVLCDSVQSKGTLMQTDEPIPLTASCLQVSSGASSSSHLLNTNNFDSYWESSGSKPHWMKVSVPSDMAWGSVQLYLSDWGSYSPEKLRLSLGDKVVKAKFGIPKSGGWVTVFNIEELQEEMVESAVNNIKIEILENYEGGCDSKVAGLRLLSGGNRFRNVVLSPLRFSDTGKSHTIARVEDAVSTGLPDKECLVASTKILSNNQLIDAILPVLSMSTHDERRYLAAANNGTAQSVTIETNHPYEDNMDQYWDVDFKDTDLLIVTFDELSATERSNDYVQFFSDRSKSIQYGSNKYHGGAGNRNWPGVQGTEPLRIEASKCVVYFHSDGSRTDWGFRLHIKAIKTTKITDDLYIRPRDLNLLQKRYFKSEALDIASVILNRQECHHVVPKLLPVLVEALIAPMVARSADADYLYAAINDEDKDLTAITSFNHFRLNVSGISRDIQQKLHQIFTSVDQVKKESIVTIKRSTYKPPRMPLFFNDAGFAIGLGSSDKGKGKFYCGREAANAGSDGKCGPASGPQCSNCKVFVPQNSAGVAMKPGSTERLYCGRRLGREAIPGSDGQCGPNNGPQCTDCRTFQENEQVKDRSILPISNQDFDALVARELVEAVVALSAPRSPVEEKQEIIDNSSSSGLARNVVQPEAASILYQRYSDILSGLRGDMAVTLLSDASIEGYVATAVPDVPAAATAETDEIAEEKPSEEFVMCDEELFLLAIDEASRDEQLTIAPSELIAKLSPEMRERALRLQHKEDKKPTSAKKATASTASPAAGLVVRRTTHTSLCCRCSGSMQLNWPLKSDSLHKDECTWECCDSKWTAETCSIGGGYITKYHPNHTLLKTTGGRCSTATCDVCQTSGVSAFFCANCDFDVCKPCLEKEKSELEYLAQWDESTVALYSGLCDELFADDDTASAESYASNAQLLPGANARKSKIADKNVNYSVSEAVLAEEFECLIRYKTHDILCQALQRCGAARMPITRDMESMFIMITRLAMIEYSHGYQKLMLTVLSCFREMLQATPVQAIELLERLIYWNTVKADPFLVEEEWGASVVSSLLTSRLSEVALFSVNLLVNKLSDDLKASNDKGATATSFFNSSTGTIIFHCLQKFSNYFDPQLNKTKADSCGLCSWCLYGRDSLVCSKRSAIKYGVGIVHSIFTLIENYVVVDQLSPATSPLIVKIAKVFSTFCQFNLSANKGKAKDKVTAFFTDLGATVQQVLTKMALIQLKQKYLYPRYNFRSKIPVIVSTGKNLVKNATATGISVDAVVSYPSVALGSDIVGSSDTTYSFYIKVNCATYAASTKFSADEWEVTNKTSRLAYMNEEARSATMSRTKHKGVFRNTEDSELNQFCSLPDQPEGAVCEHAGGIICRSHWSCCGSDLFNSRYCSPVAGRENRSADGDNEDEDQENEDDEEDNDDEDGDDLHEDDDEHSDEDDDDDDEEHDDDDDDDDQSHDDDEDDEEHSDDDDDDQSHDDDEDENSVVSRIRVDTDDEYQSHEDEDEDEDDDDEEHSNDDDDEDENENEKDEPHFGEYVEDPKQPKITEFFSLLNTPRETVSCEVQERWPRSPSNLPSVSVKGESQSGKLRNTKTKKISNCIEMHPANSTPSTAGVINIGMCDFSNSNLNGSLFSLPCFSFGYSSDGKLFCNSTTVSDQVSGFEMNDIVGIHVSFGPTNDVDNMKRVTWRVSKNYTIVSEPLDSYISNDVMVRPAISLSSSSQSVEFIAPQNQVIFPHSCFPQYISPFNKSSSQRKDMTALYQSVYVRQLMRKLIYKSNICEDNYEDFTRMCSTELTRVIKSSSLTATTTLCIDRAIGYRVSLNAIDGCKDQLPSAGSLIIECMNDVAPKGCEPTVPASIRIPLAAMSKDSFNSSGITDQINCPVNYNKTSLIQFESMQSSDIVHVGATVTRGPHWSAAGTLNGDADVDGGVGSLGIIAGVKDDFNKGFKPIKVLTVQWMVTNDMGKYIWGSGVYEVVVVEPSNDPLRCANYLFATAVNVYLEGVISQMLDTFEVRISPIFLPQDLLHHSNFQSLRAKYEGEFRLSDDEIKAIGRCIDDYHSMNFSDHSSQKIIQNFHSMHGLEFSKLVTSRDKEAKDSVTGIIPHTSARYFSHLSSKGHTKAYPDTIETSHPYEHNMDLYWDVSMDDVDHLLITFDEKSATEDSHDYVMVVSDRKKTKVYGRYTGAAGARWPGVRGKAPLKVKASKCVLYFHSDGSTNDWGFKVSITGVKVDKETRYMDIDNYPELRYLRYNSRSFSSHYHTILDLKEHLVSLLKSIKFKESTIAGSLLWMILRLRHLIPKAIRSSIINKALEESTTKAASFEISVDRVSPIRHIDRGEVDTDGQWSVFSQLFRELTSRSVADLCSNDRSFKINLGEGAIDGGGPYREVWTNLAEDLMSSYLPILVPSPNQRTKTGENQEKWALNPKCTTPVQLQMLGFLGKLMGMAIRSHNYLEIELSQVCWKLIADEHVSMRDFQLHDEQLLSFMYLIEAADSAESLADCFGDSVKYFTTVSSLTMDEVELHPGGASTVVTMDNKHTYVEELQKFISEEMRVVAATIRAGIATIIPPVSLLLMSGGELEMLVCGDPCIDLSVLKTKTQLEGWSSSDPFKVYFWSMLEEFSPKELSMLIRFSWGRSRLPKKSDFTWKVTKLDCSNYDQRLPEAHTCFFQICIPPYSSKEIAAEKIKYAIHSIDMSMR